MYSTDISTIAVVVFVICCISVGEAPDKGRLTREGVHRRGRRRALEIRAAWRVRAVPPPRHPSSPRVVVLSDDPVAVPVITRS